MLSVYRRAPSAERTESIRIQYLYEYNILSFQISRMIATFFMASTAAASASRVALVTGATKGIGLGIARGLAEKQYRVHITGRTVSGPGSLETAAEAIRAAGGECVVQWVAQSRTVDL
jgi:NAD(P)-dependent dehydrogenase (short-subunit alcohol dehydrogenase family)